MVVAYRPPRHPHERADLEDHELMALKALDAGKASDSQQRIALKVILMKFARLYDMSYRPGGAEGSRETDFAEGMRSVGSAIMEAVNRPMKASGDPNARTDTNSPESSATGTAAGRKNPKPERPKSKPAKPAASG